MEALLGTWDSGFLRGCDRDTSRNNTRKRRIRIEQLHKRGGHLAKGLLDP